MNKTTKVKRHLRRTRKGPRVVRHHARLINIGGRKILVADRSDKRRLERDASIRRTYQYKARRAKKRPLVINVYPEDYKKIKRMRMAEWSSPKEYEKVSGHMKEGKLFGKHFNIGYAAALIDAGLVERGKLKKVRAQMAKGRLGRPLNMAFVNEAQAAYEIKQDEKRKGRKLKSDELQEVYDEFNIY